MKILITGSKGLLGEELCRVLATRHGVVGKARAHMDICQASVTQECIRSESPDLVIHAAAFTDADACEADPDTAFRVHVVGTENVALACQKAGAAMLYISSGGVFNGQKDRPYTEFDAPDPLTVHHKSKLAGEHVTSQLITRFYIVRLGWLFGGSFSHRKNFVARRLEEAAGREQLLANADQWGSPTYTRDAAVQIEELIEREHYGTYHIANTGFCSRFEYVREILQLAGYPTRVIPAPAVCFRRAAPVARNEGIRNYHLQLLGLDKMRPWKAALQSYIEELVREGSVATIPARVGC